jgi:UDP-glucose 4-epimerase
MQLEVDPEVEAVVGLDVAPLADAESYTKLTFVQRSVAEPFEDVWSEHGVDTAVHLAFCLNPERDRELEQKVNLEGTRNFFAACSASGAQTVCLVSSATVYGASADGPEVCYEGTGLAAKPSFPYAHDKVQAEAMSFDFMKDHPDVALQIVRPCIIVGPNVDNYLTRMLDRPFVIVPLGKPASFQFIHEDDATRAIYKLIKLRCMGIFNLAGDGALTLPQLAHIAEKRCLTLPVSVIRLLAWVGWKLGWTWLSEAPPGFVDYCTHPWLIANSKVKTEAYFMYRHDGPGAVLDYLEARPLEGSGAVALPEPPRRPELADTDEGELDPFAGEDEPEQAPAAPTPSDLDPFGEDEAEAEAEAEEVDVEAEAEEVEAEAEAEEAEAEEAEAEEVEAEEVEAEAEAEAEAEEAVRSEQEETEGLREAEEPETAESSGSLTGDGA